VLACFAGVAGESGRRAQERTLAGQHQLIERALLLGHRLVDALNLLVGDDIFAAAFQPLQPFVIVGFEGIDRALEFVERVFDFAPFGHSAQGFGFQFHVVSLLH
jgi:hypothetical protein